MPPYNGSGTYTLTAGQPVVAGTDILDSTFNTLTADLATALSTCVTRDGQSPPTTNLPMGSFKLTGLAAGTASGHSVRFEQLQTGVNKLITVAGTGDVITGVMTPTYGAYTNGDMFTFIVGSTNTTNVTINIDGLGAKAITNGTTALTAGELTASRVVVVQYDGTQFQLLNSYLVTTGTGNLVRATSPTLITPALGTPTALVGTNITGTATAFNINGTVGATTPAAGTFTSLSDSGNLTFTGTGNRITGDFSNATIANRVLIQTSTTNGQTAIGAIPNGTSTQAQFIAFNGTDQSNSAYVQVVITSTDGRFQSGQLGTGTALPMTFYTGGSEKIRIDTSGNVGIGTSSPTCLLDVDKSQNASTSFQVKNSNAGASATSDIYVNNGTTYSFLRQFGTATAFPNQTWLSTTSANPLVFGTNTTERMRIDSSGNVLVAGASFNANGSVCIGPIGTAANGCTAVSASTAATNIWRFYNPNGNIGTISISAS